MSADQPPVAETPRRGGFANSYLKEIPGEDDWICVLDFCGRSSVFPVANLTVWWSPSRKVASFGCHYAGVPDMPSDTEPTEDQVETWASNNPGTSIYQLRFLAERRKAAKREADLAETRAKLAALGGGNHAWVKLELDGTVSYEDGPVGVHGTLRVMRNLAYALDSKKVRWKIIRLHVGHPSKVPSFYQKSKTHHPTR